MRVWNESQLGVASSLLGMPWMCHWSCGVVKNETDLLCRWKPIWGWRCNCLPSRKWGRMNCVYCNMKISKRRVMRTCVNNSTGEHKWRFSSCINAEGFQWYIASLAMSFGCPEGHRSAAVNIQMIAMYVRIAMMTIGGKNELRYCINFIS